ncbi:MAG: oligosaccharide flippase family protein [Actinomycetota bacterium]
MSQRPTFRSALGWSLVMTGGQQAIGLVITFTLAGLLGPEAFGIVAIGTVYVAFGQLLTNQGMLPAVVQRAELRREHTDTAFWMTMGAAVVATAASLAAAPLLAELNDLPELRDVIWALSLTIPLRASAVVPDALLRRELEFRKLAARSNAAALVGGVVGLVLAIGGAGVWALVAQQLTAAVVEVGLLWAITSWRPRRRWDRAAAADLWVYTRGALAAAIGSFVHNRGDVVFLGLFFGPVVVGLYRLGARLVSVVLDVSARAMQQATLPELARLQDQPGRLYRRTIELVRATAVMSWTTFGALAAIAPWLLDVLGDEWTDAVPALQLLCVVGAVTAFGMAVAAVLQAVGSTMEFAKVTWLAAATSAVSFVLAGWALDGRSVGAQVAGVAAVRAAVFAGPLLVMNLLVLRAAAHVRIGTTIRVSLPSVAAGAAGAAVGAVLWAVAPPLRNWFPGGAIAAVLIGATVLAVLVRGEPEAALQLRRTRDALGRRIERPSQQRTSP